MSLEKRIEEKEQLINKVKKLLKEINKLEAGLKDVKLCTRLNVQVQCNYVTDTTVTRNVAIPLTKGEVVEMLECILVTKRAEFDSLNEKI